MDEKKIPVIHISLSAYLFEMYLTRAIILFIQGDVAGAIHDVNVIRERAGLEPLSTVTEQDIHNERIKEMSQKETGLIVRALKLPILPGDRDPSLPTSTIS
ncbi:MAG: RagB/SusD family nutrient uptake outer membrane protein [Anditalea sp.]